MMSKFLGKLFSNLLRKKDSKAEALAKEILPVPEIAVDIAAEGVRAIEKEVRKRKARKKA
jgi:hypothetical protein